MKIILNILLLAILMTIVSCTTFTITDAASLHKGMTVEETRIVTKIEPVETVTINSTISGAMIEVHVYKLSSGDYASNYLLSFEDGALLYWGYPHEYARENNPLLNEIGKLAVTSIQKNE